MSRLTKDDFTPEERRKLRWNRVLQRLRVPVALTLALSLLFFAKPSLTSMLIGCSLAFLGMMIRGWAAGHIRKDAELATTGPYAYCRNPLYLGSFLLGTGFTFASGVWWIGLVFMIYFLAVYIPVMHAEMVDLGKLFGKEYQAYAASVPLFLPRIYSKNTGEGHFDVALYLRHREYRVIIGYTLALGFFAARVIYF